MSTVVVVRKAKQAAIGADTLAKLGATKESAEYVVNPTKIIKIGTLILQRWGMHPGTWSSPVISQSLKRLRN